jgi:endonuclease/exonuclease/phosphatase family metal-dependent hydrolase
VYDFIPGITSQDLVSRAIIIANISHDGKKYTIGTTHFTWSENGLASTQQRRDIKSLFEIIDKHPEIVFCGDFNAPRGREIFERISSKYKDNIPQNYTTSIDSDFHYAGRLDILVDGLFSTMGYEVNDVKLINGVSDHCAIIASIKRL